MKKQKDRKLNILIGVTGGIAAYKACELIRLFKKEGHSVKVILTENGSKFITPLTLETLSESKVFTGLFNKESFSTEHISLSKWADLLIVAPATANIIGKFAGGIADDILSTIFLSITKPVFVAPAMHTEMYKNIIVSGNILKLKNIGVYFINPARGALASGDTGEGRLAEPSSIKEFVKGQILKKKSLAGKKVLITAGPTQEYLDPVRYISSPSSGKMGIAIAREAGARGADVTLIHGPINFDSELNCKLVPVKTAGEMEKAVNMHKACDIFISSAAVSDFSFDKMAGEKIKSSRHMQTVKLKQNPDILKNFSHKYGRGKIIVGFAAETNDLRKNALKKLKDKKLDIIVANNVLTKGSGFKSDYNKATIIRKSGKETTLPLMSKAALAASILDTIDSIKK